MHNHDQTANVQYFCSLANLIHHLFTGLSIQSRDGCIRKIFARWPLPLCCKYFAATALPVLPFIWLYVDGRVAVPEMRQQV